MSNPKDIVGIKKPPVHLVPAALIINVAMAMKDGALKYGPYNWRSHPVNLTVYIGAAQRHLLQLLDGEDEAQDSKRHHASHVAACMGIILDALATGNLIDDRPVKGAASRLIDELTSKSDGPSKPTQGNISDSVAIVTTSNDPASIVTTGYNSNVVRPNYYGTNSGLTSTPVIPPVSS